MKIEQFNMTFPGEGDMALLLATEEAAEGTMLLGTCTVKRGGPVAEFARLFVREGFRRKGVARALLCRAREIAIAAGCVGLSCCVNPTNKGARLCYSRLGFKTAFEFPDGDVLLTYPIPPLQVVQSEGGAS